ncbi:TVP38/TMEM64 family protein [Paenibacillus glycanilyticus]|uniref:TVP38/TMEM64 family protein n=1 Tax=Paenibacillus glycanilyticus TaxID=126569 RepID=UPI000FD7782B|nr:VTT domain-containing protein [Paenibacillus glycanilyticus]
MKLLKPVLFSVYGLLIIALLMNKEQFLLWIQYNNNFIILFSAAVMLAFIPVIPYGIVAGIMGLKYGPFIGGTINVLSSTIAAALLFLLVRFLFQEQGLSYLKKFKKMEQFTGLMERNAFFAVLIARLIPFVPAAFVNIYSAISRMRFVTFIVATFVGKIPVMFVFAIVGNQFLSNISNVLWITLFYMIFLFLVYLVYRRLQ